MKQKYRNPTFTPKEYQRLEVLALHPEDYQDPHRPTKAPEARIDKAKIPAKGQVRAEKQGQVACDTDILKVRGVDEEKQQLRPVI
jgi:hypothetical protein